MMTVSLAAVGFEIIFVSIERDLVCLKKAFDLLWNICRSIEGTARLEIARTDTDIEGIVRRMDERKDDCSDTDDENGFTETPNLRTSAGRSVSDKHGIQILDKIESVSELLHSWDGEDIYFLVTLNSSVETLPPSKKQQHLHWLHWLRQTKESRETSMPKIVLIAS